MSAKILEFPVPPSPNPTRNETLAILAAIDESVRMLKPYNHLQEVQEIMRQISAVDASLTMRLKES